MNKKGFTLIEIIICIALIAVIGTASVVGVNIYSNKKETNILEKNQSNFENALEVYLSEHSDVVDNVNNNAKAAVVSLELLKNEGLISDNLNIDYKNNYYTLSNAVLLSNESTEDCSNQISLKTFASWKLDDKSSEVIYICPKDKEEKPNNTNVNVDVLLKRIEVLEKLQGSTQNVYKGEDVNNYVYFDVDTVDFEIEKDQMAKFPSENKNLWRIHSYYGIDGTSNNIKLVYNQPVELNGDFIIEIEMYESSSKNMSYYDLYSNEWMSISVNRNDRYEFGGCKYTDEYGDKYNVYKFLNKYYYGKIVGKAYYIREFESNDLDDYLPNIFSNCIAKTTNNGFYLKDFNVALDSNDEYPKLSIKNSLYQKITHKDWIESYPYYNRYEGENKLAVKIDYSSVAYQKIGFLNNSEYVDTVAGGKTWLNYYDNNIIGSVSKFETYAVYPSLRTVIDTSDAEVSATFIPVITLKVGVEIKKDESCVGVPGSIECPYKLVYNGESTGA